MGMIWMIGWRQNERFWKKSDSKAETSLKHPDLPPEGHVEENE
jgi:hypothetical protein